MPRERGPLELAEPGHEGVQVPPAVAAMAAGGVEGRQPALVGPFSDRALRDSEILRRLTEGQPVCAVISVRLPARPAPDLGHPGI